MMPAGIFHEISIWFRSQLLYNSASGQEEFSVHKRVLGGIALCCLIGPAATAVDCHRGSRLKEKSQGCGVDHLKD